MSKQEQTMEHDKKKIEEIIYKELPRIEMHGEDMASTGDFIVLMKQYAEHIVQQARQERDKEIVEIIEKYKKRVGIPNGFDNQAGISCGNHEASDFIIKSINRENYEKDLSD